jgi:hypothetical protein
LGDGSVQTMHTELCRLNRTRLCQLGVRTIGEANGITSSGKLSQAAKATHLRLYTRR